MNLDLSGLLTNEVQQALRIIALVLGMLHLLTFVIFYRQVATAAEQIRTSRTPILLGIMIVHILLLVGILLMVIFY